MTQYPLYIFIHLHKCAGSTIVAHLRKNLRPEEIVSLYYFEDDKLTNREAVKKRLLGLSPEQRDKLKVIFGHEAYYGLHELFPGREIRYFTFLRNPIERTISHYNFHRTQFESGQMRDYLKFYISRHGQTLPFNHWLEENERHKNFIFRHLYSHFFGEELFDGWRNVELKEESFSQIKKILDQFYFVGLTKNQKDLFFIYHQLGLKKFISDQNISRKYFQLKDHPEDFPLLRDNNRFDQAIYDHGVDLNRNFKKKHPLFYLKTTWTGLIRKLYLNHDYVMVQIYNRSAKLKENSPLYVKLVNQIKGIKTKT